MKKKSTDMSKYLVHLNRVMEWYQDSLPQEKRPNVIQASREANLAMNDEPPTSRRAAYYAAVIIRKAYAAYFQAKRMEKKDISDIMCGLTANTWGMRKLGYGTDDYHPLLEQGKLGYPPLVRFDKRHPQPEYRKPQF